MALYRFRLEDKASGERRIVTASDVSADAAEASVMAKEEKKVAYHLSPEEAAGLEERLKDGTLTGRDKARLFAHQQEKPYVIVKGKES
jgi:hypothetical protein